MKFLHVLVNPLWRVCPLLLFPPSALLVGQTLHLSRATTSPGEPVAMEISFESPTDRETSALQWETTIPSAKLIFLDNNSSIGPAARAAGKSLSCSVKAKTADTKTLVCILYGGLGTIHDGLVAVMHLKVLPGASPGKAIVRVDEALAVSKDLKRFPIKASETAVTIRSK